MAIYEEKEHDETNLAKKVVVVRDDSDILKDIDTSVTRNSDNFITQIIMTNGTTTKTIDVTRDANNFITEITTTVS